MVSSEGTLRQKCTAMPMLRRSYSPGGIGRKPAITAIYITGMDRNNQKLRETVITGYRSTRQVSSPSYCMYELGTLLCL